MGIVAILMIALLCLAIGFEKGYVPADHGAVVICFMALKQMEERMEDDGK